MSSQLPIRISFGLVNAYLLRGARGDVLIDTGLPGMGGRLLRSLEKCGSSVDRLALVILTHVHLDHVGNLALVRRRVRAPVLAHRLEAPLLESGRVVLPAGQTFLARGLMGLGGVVAPFLRFAPCRPHIVVDDERSLRDFGIAGRVVHTPGHTAGSISVVLDDGSAVVGDLCQNGWGFGLGAGRIVPPLADLPGAVASSWRRLQACGVQRLYPGHGEPFEAGMLAARLPALEAGV